MAKKTVSYQCVHCGATYGKWQGQCDGCGAWNSIEEDVSAGDSTPQAAQLGGGGQTIQFVDLAGEDKPLPRYITPFTEFNRVCGGGLVPGGAVLVGGDPGIGKSTLLLQVSAALSASETVLYISGEESVGQIRLRAGRLGLADTAVKLAAHSNVGDVIKTLSQGDVPALVVIDSIQTMYADVLTAAPGTVSQVRFCCQELVRLAKKRGFALVLVGHVTKDGQVAGPKVLEHMVDAVLYFEGERGHQYRILRSIKNRFGAADEIGVFAMGDCGLEEVRNPSALFLQSDGAAVSGSAVFAGIEGTRALLVEIQALVSTSAYGTPRRAAIGLDGSRLAMLLAVLESRCGLNFAQKDIFVSVAGGLKIYEPAADMAILAALLSAAQDKPLPRRTALFGEVALSGRIRPVSHMPVRVKEAVKLGYDNILLPKASTALEAEADLKSLSHIHNLLAFVSQASLAKQAAHA